MNRLRRRDGTSRLVVVGEEEMVVVVGMPGKMAEKVKDIAGRMVGGVEGRVVVATAHSLGAGEELGEDCPWLSTIVVFWCKRMMRENPEESADIYCIGVQASYTQITHGEMGEPRRNGAKRFHY